MLALIAGILCLSNFIYRYIEFHEKDWLILAAGILILALGISSWFRKRQS